MGGKSPKPASSSIWFPSPESAGLEWVMGKAWGEVLVTVPCASDMPRVFVEIPYWTQAMPVLASWTHSGLKGGLCLLELDCCPT